MKRNRQIIKENYQDLDPLCSEFITWAMGDGAKSGRINPMGLLYEYYYEDNDDALLQVAEEFSDVSGYDIEEVYEAARKAANYYFHYNPIENKVNETKNMSKKNTIRLTESELKQVINESVKQIISELDWKTYMNAANKRLQQSKDDPKRSKELWDKAWELGKYANEKFHDEYIGNYRYDTMGDKLKGKKSAKFDAHLIPSSGKMAYGNIRGWNKGGNKIFSTEKGVYHNNQGGIVTPRQHFRDAEIADAYSRANDELWDYENGNYDYTKGRGWHLKDDE